MSKQRLRVGILLPNNFHPENWELRIIDFLNSHERIDIVLTINDGRKELKRDKLKVKLKNGKIVDVLGKILLSFQRKIEKALFPRTRTISQEYIRDILKRTDAIDVFPKEKGFVDIFSQEDVNKISAYKLDLILRHGFGIIKGKVLGAALHGIWSFHHGDNSVNRGGPAGFWEVANKEDYVGCTLQRITEELDGGYVIDKGYFNRHWSYYKTQTLVYEGSVTLIEKNIERLLVGKVEYYPSGPYDGPLYTSPNLVELIRYAHRFYCHLTSKFFMSIGDKYFGLERYKWSLYIGTGKMKNASLFRAKEKSAPKGEFWADPFVFSNNGVDYIFFENYSYRTKKGVISCGRLKDGAIIDILDVLIKPYHLSYPCVFRHEGRVYMIPETHENKGLEIYECKSFPSDWELVTKAFEGEEIVDVTYHEDAKGCSWLFMNKRKTPTCQFDNELYVYKIIDLMKGDFVSHEQNPVIVDSRCARGAGITFRDGDSFFRPSQRNIQGLYGRGLNINKIDILTLSDYKESIEFSVLPNFNNNLQSLHHIHQTDEYFVFDCAKKCN